MKKGNPFPFEYHAPTAAEVDRIEKLRICYAALMDAVEASTRLGTCSGRYVALAKTALEESAMWAIKSIVFERYNDAS